MYFYITGMFSGQRFINVSIKLSSDMSMKSFMVLKHEASSQSICGEVKWFLKNILKMKAELIHVDSPRIYTLYSEWRAPTVHRSVFGFQDLPVALTAIPGVKCTPELLAQPLMKRKVMHSSLYLQNRIAICTCTSVPYRPLRYWAVYMSLIKYTIAHM